MKLYIDPRAGSEKLLDKFPGECEAQTLPAGDIAFFGHGPENADWYIGVEYKKLDDFCGSMKSGRLTGTQLPGMMRLYDVSFIVIEGIGFMDRTNGMLVKKMGKMSYSMGVNFKGFQNFIVSVSLHSALTGKPCIILRTTGLEETVGTIRGLYEWFEKPWEHHTNISRPDMTKASRIPYEMELIQIKPEDAEYPKHILRKSVFQLDRLGWDVAGKIADTFGTMENAMAASQKDWESIDRVGKGLAARAYEAFHGHPDPEVEARKRKKKE